MDTKEILVLCRSTVLEMRDLEKQMQRVLPTGRPKGIQAQQYRADPHGTNHPTSAELQLYDGLRAQYEQKRGEWESIADAARRAITESVTIWKPRDIVILTDYYILGRSDQDIAQVQGITREHACRERKRAFDKIG